MNAHQKANARALSAFVIVSLAVAGYFTGLQSPMKLPESKSPLTREEASVENLSAHEPGVIPATPYSQMPRVMQKPLVPTVLVNLKSSANLMAEVKIEPEEKLLALQRRDRNRAYNGAPPTIPHPINQISDASCVACHGVGIKTGSLRVSRMSHGFLTNCTQCHVENSPRNLQPVVFRENDFDGVKAPRAGHRAFPGAPPQIPHATWMRSDCMSCHGIAGLHGIRTTHPWRNNCQQCHAPSAKRDQTFVVGAPQFLPGPKIEK